MFLRWVVRMSYINADFEAFLIYEKPPFLYNLAKIDRKGGNCKYLSIK